MAVICAFILNAGLNFVLGLLIAKLLGPAEFGLFALATAGAVVANTVLFEWLRLSATRFYSARVRAQEPWIRQGLDRAYAVMGVALFVAALVCAALGVGSGPGSRAAILAGTAIAALGIGIFDYHAALARARFDGGLYFRLVAVKNGLAFGLMAGTAWLLPQPAWVLAAAGLSQFLAAALLWHPMRDPVAPRLRVRLAETWRLFVAYGLPLIAANAVYQLMPFLNRGTIAAQAGLAEAGYFALAADVTTRSIGTLGTALDLLLFQFAVRAEEEEGRAAAEAQIGRNVGTVVALLLPCAVGFWAILPALQALAVPDAYRGPFAAYASLMIPGFFFLAMTNFALNPVFQIRRKTLPVVAAAVIGLAVDALGLWLLPPVMGPEGIAVAQTLGLAVATLILAVRTLTGPQRLRLPWRDIVMAGLACAIMALCLAPVRHLEPVPALASSLALGILVYGAFTWTFDIAGLRSLIAARWAERRGPARQASAAPAIDVAKPDAIPNDSH
jgi:O-antigen/teichoic acid export membrane protein